MLAMLRYFMLGTQLACAARAIRPCVVLPSPPSLDLALCDRLACWDQAGWCCGRSVPWLVLSRDDSHFAYSAFTSFSLAGPS